MKTTTKRTTTKKTTARRKAARTGRAKASGSGRARVRARGKVTTKKKERIRLELRSLRLAKKKGWDLYFCMATEDPDTGKTYVAVFPEQPIDFKRKTGETYSFLAGGKGSDGMTVLEADMPSDRRMTVRAWLMQDRGKRRSAGNGMKEISSYLGKAASSLGPAAASNPYVAAALVVNGGVNTVGRLMEKAKDKNRGFVNLEEAFGGEFARKKYQDRYKAFSTKDATLRWRWRIETK